MNNERHLQHHGIKGQKWGVRRFQNKDGSLTQLGRARAGRDFVLEKGSKLQRISTSATDKETYGNRKYVSITDEDNKKWDNYFGKKYEKSGKVTYSHEYTPTKDLKVMSSVKLGKLYTQKMLDTKFKNMSEYETNSINDFYNLKRQDSPAKEAGQHIAMETETGKKLVNEILNRKYGAVFDAYGTNISSLPVVVLDPDNNMQRTRGARLSDYEKAKYKGEYMIR